MRLLLLAALLAALAVVPSTPAAAQDLPGWAEPPATREPVTLAQPPTPPPDPDPVPVGGLLALLAVAGGAYAVRRLTRDDA